MTNPHGQPLNRVKDEKKGLVQETVSGKALDRAVEMRAPIVAYAGIARQH